MESKREIFYKAFIGRDSSFEGVFVVGVKTTGVFCRPGCPAKPKPENCEFYPAAADAMLDGYRPCKVCKPLERQGNPPPDIKRLLEYMDANPAVRITDAGLNEMGLEPNRVRRWFLKNYRQTFHAYQRMYRANIAFQRIRSEGNVTEAAADSGYDSLSGFSSMFKGVIGASPTKSRGKRVVNITRVETPLGLMIAGATDVGICMFEFADYKLLDLEIRQLSETFKASLVQGENPLFDTLRCQLEQYFKGVRREFDIPLDLAGTEFQKRVWLGLRQIPYGSTTTYGKQAESLGIGSSVRAVANANGKNKISIILPCHRIIGTDGTLTGYGGGIWRKKKLLDFERDNLSSRAGAVELL